MSIGEFLGRFIGEGLGEVASNISESMGSSLERTPAGKLFKETFQNKVEPEVAQMAQGHLSGVANPTAKDFAAARGAAFETITQKYFGKDYKILPKVILATKKQSGSLAHAQNVANHISVLFKNGAEQFRHDPALKNQDIDFRSDFNNPKAWEGKLRGMMSYAFTNFLAIPHASQYFTNNLIQAAPISSMVKGLAESWGKGRNNVVQEVINSGILFDEFQYQAAEDAKGGGVLKTILHQPGFLKSRREEIIWTAATGKHLAIDAAKRAKQGNPQGEVWLKQLGLDPAKIAANNHKLTGEDLATAMYRWTDQVMFLRSPLATPAGWDKNAYSRISMMYKHWAFREGAVIKNGLMNAYKKEGMKGVAQAVGTLGIIFPAVGEFNHSAQLLLSGQDPTKRDTQHEFGGSILPAPVAEYIDAISWAGGLGIGHSMIRAAQWHGLAGWAVGPLIGTGLSIMDDVFQGKFRSVAKDTLRLGSWPGKVVANQIPTTTESKREAAKQKRLMSGKPAVAPSRKKKQEFIY